jgi:CRP/FNR family transcriptional regulator, cyclic AMP receptor protein
MCTSRMSSKLRVLREVPAFKDLSNRQLQKIDALVDEVILPTGHVLTREGQPGRQSFIVVSGWAEVSLRGRAIATVGPGSFVGEMAMLDSGPRSATVTAISPMVVLVIGPAAFATLMDLPVISGPMLQELAGRLRGVVEDRYAAA